MEFFINDMLDCAVLNSKDKNFVKSCSTFDIRVAILQIVEMMKQKIEMSNINVKVQLKGFNSYNANQLENDCSKDDHSSYYNSDDKSSAFESCGVSGHAS